MPDDSAVATASTGAPVRRLDLDMEWKPGHVAAYLVEGDEPVLIDAGVPGDEGVEDLERALADHGHALGDLEHVVVTHPHLDHVGTIPAIDDAADPEIYAPAGTEGYYDLDGRREEGRQHARLVGFEGSMLDRAVDEWMDGLERNRDCLPPDRIDHVVADGDVVEVGPLELEAIHTPGHQAHHLCFVDDGAERRMFSGDMLIGSFRSVIYQVGFGAGMFDAVEDYYRSFERLRGRCVDRVYPGHGDVFTDYEPAIDRGVDSLDELVDECADILEELGEATALDVTLQRFQDPELVQHAIFDTVGALGHLDATDRAMSERDDGVRVFRPA